VGFALRGAVFRPLALIVCLPRHARP